MDTYSCDIQMAFDSTLIATNDSLIKSGPVHIVTPDNRTIPLSLVGYDFSLSLLTRRQILQRLADHSNFADQKLSDNHKPSNQTCSTFQITEDDLNEFIQKDALPMSFLQHFTEQLPLWLKVMVSENSNSFDVENILASIIQTGEIPRVEYF